MKFFSYTFIFFLVLSSNFGYAQDSLAQKEDLTDDYAFFFETLEEYKSWLKTYNLESVVRVEDLIVEPERVILDLRIPNRHHWISLKERYKEQQGGDIRQLLFDRFVFIMEVKRPQAGIRIRSDEKDHFVDIGYLNDEFKMLESKPMGTINDTLYIDLRRIPKVEIGNSRQNTRTTIKLLKKHFAEYFDSKSNWFRTPEYEMIADGKRLYIEVYNIKGEILNDFMVPYYERIEITMTIKEKNGKVTIGYRLQGKFGSGIFVAPRKSGYKDMTKYDKPYLVPYNLKMRQRINEALNQ